MNKNLSLLLNVVLLVAVAVLFYLHFSSAPATTDAAADGTDSAALAQPVVLAPKEIKSSKIVYVNIDVLNENYEYLKDITAAARTKQSSLESQYETQGRKLQEDYMLFQQKVQQGLLSENQANAEQEEFMKRKEKIDALEMESQKLMEKIQEQSEQANQNLKKYVADYNKNSNYTYVFSYSEAVPIIILADPSLDITKEILDGLNAQYKADKEAQKTKK